MFTTPKVMNEDRKKYINIFKIKKTHNFIKLVHSSLCLESLFVIVLINFNFSRAEISFHSIPV